MQRPPTPLFQPWIKITQENYLYIKSEHQLILVVKVLRTGQLVLLYCAQECLNVIQSNVNALSGLALVYSLGSQEVDSCFTPLADLLERNTVLCAVSLSTTQPPPSSGGLSSYGVHKDSETIGNCHGIPCHPVSSLEVQPL